MQFSFEIKEAQYGAICVLFGLDPAVTCGGCLERLDVCSCHERGYN